MKKIAALYFFILISFFVNGQTNVSGGIFSNTTWTASGSPYNVTGNVVVMTGVTLTVQPGVLVKFNNGTNLEIRGFLQAIGTATDTIVFTSSSSSPSKGIWSGISFWNDLTLDYIKIAFATTALDNAYSKIINIKHSRIFNNYIGLNSIGTTSGNLGYIDSSLFDENITAVASIDEANYITNSSFRNNDVGFGYVFNVLISNNIFSGHTTKAIDGYGANYVGNLFTNNNVGLRIKLFNLAYQITDNIITNNQIGVEARGDATSTPNANFYNNTICNNLIYNVKNTDNVSLYMQNNCWCISDSGAIANSIYDAYDNLSLGIVYFSPFKAGCSNSIEDLDAIRNVVVYPNPFSSTFIIELNQQHLNAEVTIYDMLGKEMVRKKLTGDRMEIERGSLESGVYFVRVREGEREWVEKVVVE